MADFASDKQSWTQPGVSIRSVIQEGNCMHDGVNRSYMQHKTGVYKLMSTIDKRSWKVEGEVMGGTDGLMQNAKATAGGQKIEGNR